MLRALERARGGHTADLSLIKGTIKDNVGKTRVSERRFWDGPPGVTSRSIPWLVAPRATGLSLKGAVGQRGVINPSRVTHTESPRKPPGAASGDGARRKSELPPRCTAGANREHVLI